jgi:glycine betaine/choline ABC-type transport system substrate-binding protein
MSGTRFSPAPALLACLLGLGGCGGQRPNIVVGSTTGAEQELLGEIIAQHLEKQMTAARVVRRLALGQTQLTHDSIVAGEIDLYPEYSGTALVGILRLSATSDAAATREQIQEYYRFRYQFEWIGPLGFDSRYVVVVRRNEAAGRGLTTLGGAAAQESGWALGAPLEFRERLDGMPLLMRTYRLILNVPLKTLDAVMLPRALEQGQVNMIVVPATDPCTQDAANVVLTDDRHGMPPLEAGITVRRATLERVPGLHKALEMLTGKVTEDRIRAMNVQMQRKGRPAAELAREYLAAAGL